MYMYMPVDALYDSTSTRCSVVISSGGAGTDGIYIPPFRTSMNTPCALPKIIMLALSPTPIITVT